MGVIGRVLTLLFGGGNVIRDTAEVFVENTEAGAVRDAAQAQAALGQFAAEFAVPRQGVFDRAMDGINRLPRPMMALGTLGLFGAAMVDPVWFAARMEGIALVPEPLWWLLGVIVSFYFGARHQAKGHAYQRNLVESLARTRSAARALQALEAEAGTDDNPALEAWRAGR